MAAKPMRPEKTRVAAAPVSLKPNAATKAEPKPQRVAAQQAKQDAIWEQAKPAQLPAQQPAQRPEQRTEPAKPTVVAKAEPPAKPAAKAVTVPPQVRVATAAKTPPAPAREPEIRTAYSGTPPAAAAACSPAPSRLYRRALSTASAERDHLHFLAGA